MNRKYIIGISAYYHDSSVCLFKDGKLVFACEEEKFSGIKHDSSWPERSLDYIYKEFNFKHSDVEAVCYYEDPQLKLKRVRENYRPQILTNLRYAIKSDIKTRKQIKELKTNLKILSDNIFYSTHHESHMYYSFYTSSFKDAMCVSIDGVGEYDTLSVGFPTGKALKKLKYIPLAKYPHSLGLFYSAMTAFLGFKPNEGEYKVMGLSSYGNPNIFIEQMRKLISFDGLDSNTLTCNMGVFTWNRSDKVMFNEKLIDLLGISPRMPEDEIGQIHKDLAAAVQKRYEEILFSIIRYVQDWTQNTNLCLGGGCAYNGLANGKIIENTKTEHLWIPPAPSDAGSCIGACLHYLATKNKLNYRIPKNPFLGPIFESWDILSVIRKNKTACYKTNESQVYRDVAKFLANGKIVGWYHGHMEFGARALGHRSILANPLSGDVKDKINKVIKKREMFRPFAPMVIKEKQTDYFEVKDDIPYMNQVVKVKPEYIDVLKAVTHVDGTARVQTVYDNTPMYKLLIEFEKLSGYPILLNTSFNVKDKTVVRTPQDALDMFNTTEMDVLVMNNYIISK